MGRQFKVRECHSRKVRSYVNSFPGVANNTVTIMHLALNCGRHRSGSISTGLLCIFLVFAHLPAQKEKDRDAAGGTLGASASTPLNRWTNISRTAVQLRSLAWTRYLMAVPRCHPNRIFVFWVCTAFFECGRFGLLLVNLVWHYSQV
jgi:hypothetical protein